MKLFKIHNFGNGLKIKFLDSAKFKFCFIFLQYGMFGYVDAHCSKLFSKYYVNFTMRGPRTEED